MSNIVIKPNRPDILTYTVTFENVRREDLVFLAGLCGQVCGNPLPSPREFTDNLYDVVSNEFHVPSVTPLTEDSDLRVASPSYGEAVRAINNKLRHYVEDIF
jgi:hypothetical protein